MRHRHRVEGKQFFLLVPARQPDGPVADEDRAPADSVAGAGKEQYVAGAVFREMLLAYLLNQTIAELSPELAADPSHLRIALQGILYVAGETFASAAPQPASPAQPGAGA